MLYLDFYQIKFWGTRKFELWQDKIQPPFSHKIMSTLVASGHALCEK